jgi:hypothetical protein
MGSADGNANAITLCSPAVNIDLNKRTHQFANRHQMMMKNVIKKIQWKIQYLSAGEQAESSSGISMQLNGLTRVEMHSTVISNLID